MGILYVGSMTTLIGMAGIFLVLAILSIATLGMDRIVNAIEGKSRKKEQAALKGAEQPAVAAVPAAPAAAQAVAEAGISPAKVAAIVAAISAASGRPVAQLKFNAIRRGGGAATGWSNSGVAEIINTRQQYL